MYITKKDHFNDLMDYVNSRLIHRELEKKQNGEVFTPLELINGAVPKLSITKKENKLGMLDHLPKEVSWRHNSFPNGFY